METQNVNVKNVSLLSTPAKVREEFPATSKAIDTVIRARRDIGNILTDKDKRFLAVVGPCSIHDLDAAIDYGKRILELSKKVEDRICVIMRVYFEKPRTTVGWKGLINDPHLDDSFDIEQGLRLARKLLVELNEMGVPAGTEVLDPITPQYISDLISWASIGARTTESQTHRQMASGLSMPVGFKNATDGTVQIALDAMVSARSPHSFLGIDGEGRTSLIETAGNKATHLILRGGRHGTNYDYDSVVEASTQLANSNLNTGIVVDCSHGNSEKDHNKQEQVWNYVVDQVAGGNRGCLGAMLESNINPGNQKLKLPVESMQYGVSITDACIDWNKTEELLLGAYDRLESIHQSA